MSCSSNRQTRALLSALKAVNALDSSQIESVYHATRNRREVLRDARTEPTQEQWEALVNQQLETLTLDRQLDERKFARLYRYLSSVREDGPPDAHTFAALKALPVRAERAKSALRRQMHTAAAFRGVDYNDVQERFHAYREQYLNEFRALPATERPDPPATWVQGYRKRDMMAVSSPGDKATLYAMYRVQADPEAFPVNEQQRFASIDLETAGPSGRDGFNPENGSIIEVGIVEYDYDGNEVARYEQLIRPADHVAEACGTGAVHVHGINMEDVQDAPSYEQVAPEISRRLEGRTMLAQNAVFEKDWLSHHQAATGQTFDRWGPTVDTLTIARQHLSHLPRHQLSMICEEVGVPYTDGHRATHDAVVAAQAFFKMRQRIYSDYVSSPARASAPQPPRGAGASTPARSVLQRLSGGDFDPATIEDPWATPKPVPAEGAAA